MGKKVTTEEFINKAINIHGDNYNYDLVNYKNNSTKVVIICPTHGEFTQTPVSHLNARGCPKCAIDKRSRAQRLTIEEFIERSNKIHSNKYDYSLVNYINNNTKVEILCNEHGIFNQIPTNHLQGKGCTKCSARYSPTTEEFIEMAIEIHGDKYDYSKVIYKTNRIKVDIFCNIHKEFFQQTPENHLQPSNCPKCTIESYRLTTEEFIRKAIEVHGDKYDYSDVIYHDGKTKVIIGCKKCNTTFSQKARGHLNGNGCPECGKQRVSEALKTTQEEFIEKSIKIHGDKYDYSKVNYINSRNNVKIICPEHGEFSQKARLHLDGKGCSICSESHGEREIRKILNYLNIEYIRQKSFDGCKYKWPLKFDFYLSNYNICIEYNGKQHYEFSEHFHRTIDGFKESQLRDRIKNDYCRDNDISLYRISYNENIEDKLNMILEESLLS